MKRIRQKNGLLLLFFLGAFSFNSFSQSVTGIWRGYFIADNGYQYRLEFQVKQNVSYAVSGVSYSWQDDIRFYGKATMTGNYIGTSQNFRIREIKTVEVKSEGGVTCIMNYNLKYSRSGKEEFLEGTYLGKQEVKDGPNPFEWGQCGAGRVFLRKVTTSEFYIEPSLRPKKTIPDTKENVNPPVVRNPSVTPPPVIKKTTIPKKNVPAAKKPDSGSANKKAVSPPVKINEDSTKKVTPEITKIPVKPSIPAPSILKTRENKLAQSLVLTDPDVTVKLYDNGEIDDDTISVFLNKKLVLSGKRLTASPLILKFKMDEDNSDQELTMVAENLGRIPPNTSLMVVEAGEQRYEVRITSTSQKNAVVRFKYQKPK
jgi:hypothetical protein